MDKLLDSLQNVFGNRLLEYFMEQDKKHKYLQLDDYQKVIQKFIEDEQFFRTNYYSGNHVHFTRFLLVSIEKFKNNDRTIDFTELDHKGKLIWQLEHIIPQSKFEPGDSNKNNLGNLTLLHGDLNVKISNENFEEKKKVLHEEDESKFYINEVFRRNNFKKSDIDKRSSDLKNDLVDIINNHFDAYCEKVLKIKNMELNNE
ncbi:HNH endonuclease family protein [Streptococcus mitis]|uniref:HNH endonuclease n=1 Tax=Streptococcus mitis TaxID=28037 RepID=A0A1X1KPM7_STRMT|nr:HNH endonuclease family protein [Streptococcus mitis]ORP01269.1 HNH endonuclease [Streptococcus mitis]